MDQDEKQPARRVRAGAETAVIGDERQRRGGQKLTTTIVT